MHISKYNHCVPFQLQLYLRRFWVVEAARFVRPVEKPVIHWFWTKLSLQHCSRGAENPKELL